MLRGWHVLECWLKLIQCLERISDSDWRFYLVSRVSLSSLVWDITWTDITDMLILATNRVLLYSCISCSHLLWQLCDTRSWDEQQLLAQDKNWVLEVEIVETRRKWSLWISLATARVQCWDKDHKMQIDFPQTWHWEYSEFTTNNWCWVFAEWVCRILIIICTCFRLKDGDQHLTWSWVITNK